MNDILPDRGSMVDKRKRSRGTVPVPAELSPPRTTAVAWEGGQEGRGVGNAAVWPGVGWASYEYSASRYRATLSLDTCVNTAERRNLR